ncbi:MAG: hypothetical protein ACLPTJ_04975, partial [Solirubrobacteraceae bacterium]
ILRPGTNMNTSWLLAMESLYRRLGSPPDLRPDYARYQRLQALYCAQAYYLHGTISRAEMLTAAAGLTRWERSVVRLLGPVVGTVLRLSPPIMRRLGGAVYDRIVGQYAAVGLRPARDVGRYKDIIEVFERAGTHRLDVGVPS